MAQQQEQEAMVVQGAVLMEAEEEVRERVVQQEMPQHQVLVMEEMPLNIRKQQTIIYP
jgi:hypothetical protein